jgi:hypothetical protein
MTEPDSPSPLDRNLTGSRIVHGSLCAGVVIMAVVLLSIRDWQRPTPPLPILTYAGIGFLVVALGAAMIVPPMVVTDARKKFVQGKLPPGYPPETLSDPNSFWARVYDGRLIITCAFLNAVAFYQLIAFFIEGHPLSLGIAGGMLVLLLWQFPTHDGLTAFVEQQRELAEQEKQGGLE